MASGSTDGTMRLWDIRNGSSLAVLEGQTNAIMSVALAPDRQRLASGSTDGTVRLWDTGSGTCLATVHGHTNVLCNVKYFV